MNPSTRSLSQAQAAATILVVDDQEEILSFVSSYLAQNGYNILKAASGDEALQRSREFEGQIALLLSNIQMPGITGIELATKITLERPDTKVLLMSGYPSGMLVLHEGWHFLPKPFIPGQLKTLVALAIRSESGPDLDEHADQGR